MLIILLHFVWYMIMIMIMIMSVCFEIQNLQVPSFLRLRADPKNVISIVLGGGPGTHLYPLTKRAATPAVSEFYDMNSCLNLTFWCRL